MTPGILKERGRGMLYDSLRIANPRFDLLDPGRWHREQDPQTAEAGRGAVWFVDAGGEQWALRHYRRGGLIGRLVSDLFLWTGEKACRPFREFRLLLALQALRLPAPLPVAAAYKRDGLLYRADLATLRIADARPLSRILRDRSPGLSQWREIGRVVRRFHDAGVFHADLNAHNILIDERESVYLIDFDRGRLRGGEHWKKANLDRLRRSLEKISGGETGVDIDESQWRELLAGYDGSAVA